MLRAGLELSTFTLGLRVASDWSDREQKAWQGIDIPDSARRLSQSVWVDRGCDLAVVLDPWPVEVANSSRLVENFC